MYNKSITASIPLSLSWLYGSLWFLNGIAAQTSVIFLSMVRKILSSFLKINNICYSLGLYGKILMDAQHEFQLSISLCKQKCDKNKRNTRSNTSVYTANANYKYFRTVI